MGFTVSSLTDYTAEATRLITEGVLFNDNFGEFEVQTGIVYKEFLNTLTSNPSLVADGCSLSAGSGATLTEKVIEVGAIAVNEPFCYKDLTKKALGGVDVASTLTTDLNAQLKSKVEKLFWQGATASGDLINGIKYYADANATSLSVSGTVDSNNVDDMVLALINGATDAMWSRGVLTIYMPLNYFNLYKQNRLNANYYRDANEKFDLMTMWAFGYEGQVKIQAIAGLNGVDDMYITWAKNIVLGTNQVTELASAGWVDDVVNELAIYRASFKLGAQIGIDGEFVKLR